MSSANHKDGPGHGPVRSFNLGSSSDLGSSPSLGSPAHRKAESLFSLFVDFYASCILPILFLLCLGMGLILLEWLDASSGFSLNAPSPYTYRTVSPIKYTDATITNKLKDNLEGSVAGVVVRDIAGAERMQGRLEEIRGLDWNAPEQRRTPAPNRSPNRNPNTYKNPLELSDDLKKAFAVLSEERREELFLFAEQIGKVYFEEAASADFNLSSQGPRLWTEIGKLNLPPAEGNLLYQLIEEVTSPAYKTDPELAAAVRGSLRDSIPPVERRLEIGDVIVERGHTVTPQIGRLLRFQGYPENVFPLGQMLIVSLLILTLPLWLEISLQESSSNRPTWSSIVFTIGTGWVCGMTAANWGMAGAGVLAPVLIAYFSMPRRIALNVSIVGTASGIFLIVGLSVYNALSLLTAGFVASMVGFYVFRKIDSTKILAYRVLFVAAVLALVKLSNRSFQGFPVTWHSLSLSEPFGETWIVGGSIFLFELATVFLAVTFLPWIEGAIGVCSALKTRELSHPSSPLLRKLQAEAPGTYHHCLMIGTLAEAAAEELDMDVNLMKVGAYYHDIGKLRRPSYFVENQLGGKNIHDSLSPTLSAVAILSHVRDGVELANEFRLPKRVKQFISEHHGTTSLGYFYKKARLLGENVDEGQFRYPGPKPQSRETALLMLLDSLEAAMRAESKRIAVVGDIQEIIDRVIASKVSDGQLDDVDFTFKDIARIKAALLNAFRSMYHTRAVKEIK